MGPRFKVSSERLEKPGIEPRTPRLQYAKLNHYTTEASRLESEVVIISKNINLYHLSRD